MKDVNRFPRRVGEDSKDEISSRGPKEANLLITARRPFRRETREASSRGEVWQEAGNNLLSKVNSIFQFRGDFLRPPCAPISRSRNSPGFRRRSSSHQCQSLAKINKGQRVFRRADCKLPFQTKRVTRSFLHLSTCDREAKNESHRSKL